MDYPKRLITRGEIDKSIVKEIQKQLNLKGCGPLEITGNFEKDTLRCVKLFQARHFDNKGNPLIIDGMIGAITWSILFKETQISHAAVTQKSSPLLKKVIEIANSQTGVIEKPPHSNRGPEVDVFLKSVGLNPASGHYAWCAAFVYWCFEQAAKELGIENPLVRTAGVLDHWNRTTAPKVNAADAMTNPEKIKPGFVFIMDFGKGQGHTGIVESVNNGYITTIEGNTNNDNSREGYGVFRLNTRKINSIKKGYINYG